MKKYLVLLLALMMLQGTYMIFDVKAYEMPSDMELEVVKTAKEFTEKAIADQEKAIREAEAAAAVPAVIETSVTGLTLDLSCTYLYDGLFDAGTRIEVVYDTSNGTSKGLLFPADGSELIVISPSQARSQIRECEKRNKEGEFWEAVKELNSAGPSSTPESRM